MLLPCLIVFYLKYSSCYSFENSLHTIKNLILKSEPEVLNLLFDHNNRDVSIKMHSTINYLSKHIHNVSFDIRTYEHQGNIFDGNDQFQEYAVLKDAYRQWYKTTTLLIVCDNTEESVEYIFKSVQKKRERKFLNNFLVFFMEITNVNIDWPTNIFLKFWQRNVVNILIIYENDHILTYTPFTDNGQLELINVTGTNIGKEIIFPKLCNLKGYKLNISVCSNQLDYRTYTCLQIMDDYVAKTITER